jgi:hypothetical protein
MRLAGCRLALPRLTLVCIAASLAVQAHAQSRGSRQVNASRAAQLVEANVIATHAYQLLLAENSGTGDAACFARGGLSDEELQTLVKHQSNLLKSKVEDVKAWARGERPAGRAE